MPDSVNTITTDQKNALDLIECIQRFTSYGEMFSDDSLRMATDYLTTVGAVGATCVEKSLLDAAVAFLNACKGD